MPSTDSTPEQKWTSLQKHPEQAKHLSNFVSKLLQIQNAPPVTHKKAKIFNPIQYLLDDEKRVVWYAFLQKVKDNLHDARCSGTFTKSHEAVMEFHRIHNIYNLDRDGIVTLRNYFVQKSMEKQIKLSPDVFVEVLELGKELQMFVRDWKTAADGAPFAVMSEC